MRAYWVRFRANLSVWRLAVLNYVIRCGDAISQFLNVLIFFGGNPNESLSGRAYREKHKRFWYTIMKFLDWCFSPFQDEHCRKSHEADLARAAETLRGAE